MTSPVKKPRKTGKRFGNVEGLTKETNPQLANRLPRERGALIAPMGDGLTIFDKAKIILGDRMSETKACYLLDGKPCNATDLLKAVGLYVEE